MERRSFLKALCGILLVVALAGCAGGPATNDDQLDAAIRETSDYLNANLTTGNKLVILNIQSEYPALSEYIIDELIANAVNDRIFTVVDRQRLDAIRAELDFQYSGEVDDDTMQALGRMAGAEIIVSGAVSKIGNLYRLRVSALSVQSAQIEGQFNRNIPNGPTIAALVQSTGYGGSARQPAATPAASAQSSSASNSGAAPSPGAASATPAAASGGQSGLYTGDTFQGTMDLYDALEWITLNAQNNGGYRIVLGSDQKVSNVVLDYEGKKVTVSLEASGGERKVSYDIPKPSYALFTVKEGVTFTLGERVVLSGVQDAGGSLVDVDGGAFIMNGGAIKDNKKSRGNGGGVSVYNRGTFIMNKGSISGNSTYDSGGGVYVNGGTFTMNSGTISGNTSSYNGGGGVFVGNGGTFTMQDGAISGNTSSYSGGGGVYVNSSTFTMQDGAISRNTANGNGGGVLVYNRGTFTMQDGAISENTASGYGGGVALDSSTFTMNNGAISENMSANAGGGVYVYSSSSTFTKSGRGGIIYGVNAPEGANVSKSGNGHAVYISSSKKRDNTARATTAMDSTKNGVDGGWD
jgi:hypothetical protein